jgi:hypothetical protein
MVKLTEGSYLWLYIFELTSNDIARFCDIYECAEIYNDREKVSNMIKWNYHYATRAKEMMMFV